MISNGKWQPVYSMSEEKSSQGLTKKINQFQDSDASRFIQMTNSKIHRIVKKQMGFHDRNLDKSLQEKGRMPEQEIKINRDYNDSTSITHNKEIPNECKTIGRFPDVFDNRKYYDCKFHNATPQQIQCPRNTIFNPESSHCERKRPKRDIKNYDYDIAAASDNDFEPINNFEPICPMKCEKEPPGTNYMVKVLPCEKDDDDDDDDDEECDPCDPCKKVIKNKFHPFPICNKCYYCFEEKPIKIKFLYSIACPGSKSFCCTPPPQPCPPCPPKCKPAVKLPPFVCKPPQCRQVLYCKYFQCSSLGFFPDERDCTKYFFCDLNNNGFVLYHMACPPGRIFDPKLRECRLRDVMKKRRDVERCWIEKDVQKLSDIMKFKKKKKNIVKVTADKLKFDIILNKKKRDSRLKETSVENPLKINGRSRRDVQEAYKIPKQKIVTPNPIVDRLVFDVYHPIPENVFTDRNYGASGSTYRIPIPPITSTTSNPCEVRVKPKTQKKGKKKPPRPPCPPQPCPPQPCPTKPCPKKRLSRELHVSKLKNSQGDPVEIEWLPTDNIYNSVQAREYYNPESRRRQCTSVGLFPDPFDCSKYIKCESTEMVGNVKGRPLKLIRRVCPPGSFFHKKDLQCRSKNDYANKYLVRHCFRDLYITNRRLKDKLARLTQVLKSNSQHQDYEDYPDDDSVYN